MTEAHIQIHYNHKQIGWITDNDIHGRIVDSYGTYYNSLHALAKSTHNTENIYISYIGFTFKYNSFCISYSKIEHCFTQSDETTLARDISREVRGRYLHFNDLNSVDDIQLELPVTLGGQLVCGVQFEHDARMYQVKKNRKCSFFYCCKSPAYLRWISESELLEGIGLEIQ